MTQYNQTRQRNIQNLHKLIINKIFILTVSPTLARATHEWHEALVTLARIIPASAFCQIRASYLQEVINEPESFS